MKLIFCYAVIYGVFLLAGAAQAEQKLLITDVLDKGEVEILTGFTYGRAHYDYTLKSPTYQQGRVTHKSSILDGTVGMGIVNGLQLNISRPYIFEDRYEYQYLNPVKPSQSYTDDGRGALVFGSKYRLADGSDKAFTLVTGLDINLENSDNNDNSTQPSTTDIAPYLAVSSSLSDGQLRPYLSYRYVNRNHGVSDQHITNAGVEYVINKSISLTPFAAVFIIPAAATQNTYESYLLGLKTSIRLVNNLYIIPSFCFGKATAHNSRDNTLAYGDMTFYETGLQLYYLIK